MFALHSKVEQNLAAGLEGNHLTKQTLNCCALDNTGHLTSPIGQIKRFKQQPSIEPLTTEGPQHATNVTNIS